MQFYDDVLRSKADSLIAAGGTLGDIMAIFEQLLMKATLADQEVRTPLDWTRMFFLRGTAELTCVRTCHPLRCPARSLAPRTTWPGECTTAQGPAVLG